MNLFGAYDDNTPQKDQRASPEVKVAVNTLRQFAARNSWPVSRSPKNWEVPLTTLAKQVGHDKVLRAVDWYVKNHPDNMRMKLIDGKEFREHYMKVVRRMEGVEVVKVEVEEVLSATVAELKGLGWPKGSKKDVGAACQLTLLAVRGFREKLGRWYDGQPNKDTPHARLALWLLEGGMPESNVNFVEVWMERVWKRIRDWEDWNGNLLREVPQPGPTDKRWNEWGREVTGEYCEDPRRWDKLMGYVYSR